MYAIIEESGGQRRVAQGDEILVDLITDATLGQVLSFDKVLVMGESGGGAKIGQPYIAGAKVTGEVVEPEVMGEKLYIHKFRAKVGYQRKTGHRQRYTKVKVTAIG